MAHLHSKLTRGRHTVHDIALGNQRLRLCGSLRLLSASPKYFVKAFRVVTQLRPILRASKSLFSASLLRWEELNPDNAAASASEINSSLAKMS